MIPIGDLVTEAKKYVGEFKLSSDWMTAGSVSAAVLSSTGKIYTGICIDVSSGIGFCAEHSAIAQMIKDRETRIEMVVAIDAKGEVYPPCGRCREFMLLINRDNDKTKVVIDADTVITLGELLPHRRP